MTEQWFDDVPVIGEMPVDEAASYLYEVGEDDVAGAAEAEAAEQPVFRGGPVTPFAMRSIEWPFAPRAWLHTAHAFGYIAAGGTGDDPLPLQSAGSIDPDETLKNGRIVITLDRLRVADYPGGGIHHVLFDFYGRNQVPGSAEDLHFTATYRVQEGEQAAVVGYPIFVGLNVGTQGVAFKCFTVNVKNDDDEAFLGFLESDVFKGGLQLAKTLQPAIAPLSEMAFGITKSIAQRNRNVAVQDFYMGLDFSDVVTGARLATGSYVAVQIPQTEAVVWNWSDWVYHPTSGQLVSKTDHGVMIPYNYVVFGVSRYEEPAS
jgi:hypothetical protein